MAQNHQQWANERAAPRQGGRFEVDAITALSAKLDVMAKKIENLSINAVSASNTESPCELCGVSGHGPLECQKGIPLSNDKSVEHANVLGNFNRPRNDPYSNTYNPGWRNHPNFSYRNQNVENPQNAPQKSHLESMMENLISNQHKQNEFIHNQVRELASKVDQLASQSKMLETQIAQQATNTVRPSGTLPGKPELNPREH